MKNYLIFSVFVLSFYFSNADLVKNVRITRILTPRVASNGLLILDTGGLNLVLKKEDNQNINQFQLKLTRLNYNTLYTLSCFLYQFENKDSSTPKIGCRTRGLPQGTYKVSPLSTTVNLVVGKAIFLRVIVRINPSEITGTFQITEGNELYFYDYKAKDEDFEHTGHIEDIEFSLFEPVTGQVKIYFDNIPIDCFATKYKLTCNLYASKFQRVRNRNYLVYTTDSAGNKKRNYFVLPVKITLNYL